ncbi:Type 1 glutamine amidotransferase-like domain-containing protein [Candidatus Saccharibacteria bacterium]|nr:Type 1 glutamine amidotransferase-like domain-containing protein [Candidatus Saccharibacteria bacterium]
MPIVLSSCGIIKPDFKNKVLALFRKPANSIKLLYITTAADGESGDMSWADAEYKNILALGILDKNIHEYKIGSSEVNLDTFDVVYVLGGNTFYLMNKIREFDFDKQIKSAIEKGITYIGSSAGSIILGTTLKPAEVYGDIPVSDKQSYDGLGIINGAIIPHMNQKSDAYKTWLDTWDGESYILYDGDGIIIK